MGQGNQNNGYPTTWQSGQGNPNNGYPTAWQNGHMDRCQYSNSAPFLAGPTPPPPPRSVQGPKQRDEIDKEDGGNVPKDDIRNIEHELAKEHVNKNNEIKSKERPWKLMIPLL